MNEGREMLDSRERGKRIEAVQTLKEKLTAYDRGNRRDTNNHIHSKYSFHPITRQRRRCWPVKQDWRRPAS